MSALRLESETRLLGATPDYRQGMAILAAIYKPPGWLWSVHGL